MRQNAPPLPGVYALSNAREWLFVGQADDVQAALRAHLAEVGTKLQAARPTGFTFEVCDPFARTSLVAQLISQLAPSFNSPLQS